MNLSMFLLALVLGLDIGAGSISLGLTGLERQRWVKVALLFAFLSFFTTTLGVLFGRLLGDSFGSHAAYLAGALLLILGLRALAEVFFGDHAAGPPKILSTTDIIVIGLVISLDKFAVGFSLAFVETSLTGFLAYLVVQTFIVTLIGLYLGKRLGARIGAAAELVAGAIFVLLGAVIIYQTWAGKSFL